MWPAAGATTDASRAHRAAADVEAGGVWINQYHGGGPGVPFGDYRESGSGGRYGSKWRLEAMMQTKAVVMHCGGE